MWRSSTYRWYLMLNGLLPRTHSLFLSFYKSHDVIVLDTFSNCGLSCRSRFSFVPFRVQGSHRDTDCSDTRGETVTIAPEHPVSTRCREENEGKLSRVSGSQRSHGSKGSQGSHSHLRGGGAYLCGFTPWKQLSCPSSPMKNSPRVLLHTCWGHLTPSCLGS